VRDAAATMTTMPPVRPARGHQARTAWPRHYAIGSATQSTQSNTVNVAVGVADDDRQGFGSGAKGEKGQRHVDDHPPPADRPRRTPADCRRAAAPGARRLGTRWGYLPAGERLDARIAGIDAPETHAEQVKCRGENALGRSATARVGILVEGQTITVIRVGNSYNRTVARVRLAAGDVGSELMATGAARSRR
jgi:hypothetical protein